MPLQEDENLEKEMRRKSRGITLSREQRLKIKSLRTTARLSRIQLKNKAEISLKTVDSLESAIEGPIKFDESTLTSVATALSVPYAALIDPVSGCAGFWKLPSDFLSIADSFRQIDQSIIPVIHDLTLPKELVSKAYDDLLETRVQKSGLTLAEIRTLVNDPAWIKNLQFYFSDQSLLIDVEDHFKKLKFIINEGCITVDNPALLWDCHCMTPVDRQELFRCPIHNNPLGDLVRTRFRGDIVTIRYRGLEFFWRYGSELFPPSCDSFHMINVLEQEGIFDEPMDTCLDIGAGTGFIGICLAAFNKHITRVQLTDWLLTPALYSATNAMRNFDQCKQAKFAVKMQLFTNPLPVTERRYDIVVCNPPYLPLLEKYRSVGWQSAVAGTDLLEHTISAAGNLGKRVYIQLSNLAMPEAVAAQHAAGCNLRPIGKAREVPFRLEIVWEKPEYIKELLKRGLIYDKSRRHPYWHSIQTYLLEPSD
jgi:methylase of polypeptide subunit release factors